MKKILLSAAVLFVYTAIHAQEADLIIKNGKLMDGTGNQWQYKDIAISKNKIIAIGQLKNWKATKTIDAKGLIVAPGFIDVHGHVEGGESRNPLAGNFIYDGVTTVITGNCGGSADNLNTYFNTVDSIGTSINIASLMGHNNIRKQVMGTANRNATEEELVKMEFLTQKAMQDGAVGMSTGLIYIPGTYAPTEEVVRLAKVISANGGVYSSHIRYEEDKVVDAVNEAIHIGRAANIPVEISHFKVSGQNNWGRSKETIPLVMNARKEGIDFILDPMMNNIDPSLHEHIDGLMTIHKLQYKIDSESSNPLDNVHTVIANNMFVINISTFMTGIKFEHDNYHKYDLREPPRKIIHPNRIKTTKIDHITDDWSNIPFYPTIEKKNNNMFRPGCLG